MTLIPMLSALKGRAPLAFPEEPERAPWQPRSRLGRPAAATRRGIFAAVRGVFFGAAWLLVRAWRGVVRLVSPVMGKASDLAMAPYGRAERGYLRLLPTALAKPAL